MAVDEKGTCDIEILEGKIEVSLLGSDGQMVTTCALGQQESVRVHSGTQPQLTKLAKPRQSLSELKDASSPRPLAASNAYVQAVRDAAPEIYWRFNDVVNGIVPNEVGDRFSGCLRSSSGNGRNISVTQGMLVFSPSPGSSQWAGNRRADPSG